MLYATIIITWVTLGPINHTLLDQVLDSLESIAKVKTRAILPSEQWCQESEAGCEEDEGEKPKKKKKKSVKKKKKKGGNKKKSKPCAEKNPASNNSACLYKPGEFREIRLKFIADLRKSEDVTWSEACKRWNTSERRDLDFLEVFAGMGHVSQCLRQDWSLAIRSRATSGRNEINPNGNTGYGSVFEAKWYMGFFGQLSCKRHIGYSNARTYPRRFGLLLADYWRTNQDSEDELGGPRMSTDIDMSKTDFELFLPLLRSTTVAEFAEADLLSCVKYLLRSKSIHFRGQWGLVEALKRGKLVRDGIRALKVHKAEERDKTKAKGNKSSSSACSSKLSIASHTNPHGIPDEPPIALTERLSGEGTMSLEELMKSERLTYADAVVVFENVREGLREQEAAAAAASPATTKTPKVKENKKEKAEPLRRSKASTHLAEEEEPQDTEEDEPKGVTIAPKARATKPKNKADKARKPEEPAEDSKQGGRGKSKKARKAEAVPEEEPSEEPKPRRAKAKARKPEAVPQEEPEDEEPKPRRAKARKPEAVPQEPSEDEEPKPRRAKSASKAKQNKGKPSPSKSIETPPKVRLSSKSKPTKRRKLAQDEDTVAADSEAERLAEVQAMLDEIDRVSEARSASKGKEEEDPFPETLVDPAPPEEQQQDEDEPQGDKEPEEDEPQGDKEREEDDPQGDEELEEDDPQGDEELEEDEPQGDEEQNDGEPLEDDEAGDDDEGGAPCVVALQGQLGCTALRFMVQSVCMPCANDELGASDSTSSGTIPGDFDDSEAWLTELLAYGLVAPPDHFELPVTVAVHPRGAVMEKNGHVLLSKQGKTGYRIDFTSPGMPSSSVKTRSRTFRNFSDRYEHEISNTLSRMDRLLQQKEAAATTTKTAAPTTKTAATTVKPVPTPVRASSMPAIVDVDPPKAKTHHFGKGAAARAHQSGKFASCPNISQLMDGSLTDRNKALREWVSKGGNIDAMETSLEMHRQESLKVLNRLSGRSLGFGQEPSSSVYKGAGKKRGQFHCAAVKKEIGQLSNMIIDMSQADSPDLLKSLKAHDAKMKAFSLKLGMTKAGEKFDGLCEQIHEEASLPPALDPRLRVIARALLEEDFVESMYPSSADLHSYWAQLLPDFPDHWLKNKRKLWSYTIPIVLWGDEGTPDLSVFREHSKASRYMIYSLLASRYFVNGKTNETLQNLNAAVVKETYYFVPVAFRGDLKYLTQCFNFVRNASTPQVCFKCLASRSDPGMLYTDINVDAPWTTTEYSHEPWVDRPAFAFIDGFDLQMVQVDWMHTSRCAMSSGVFLTMEQQRHLRVVGDVFLSSYCALATIACDRGEYYFKLRPKFHHLIHMLRDKRPSKRSPGWDNCYMDEDHIKHCVRILRKVSHRTAELSLLKRNAVQAKQALLECLLPK
ncbi:unnamed protein product [Symbiodinium sp. CCMP2592]|nr:unnamed protein product [Symbiodinium sp. CCMP2592]